MRKYIVKFKNQIRRSAIWHGFIGKTWEKFAVWRRSRLLKKYGPDALRQMKAAMRESGVKYFLDCGTLLGLIREGRLLQHDHDIDISIPPNGGSPAKLVEALLKHGYVFSRGVEYEDVLDAISMTYRGIPVDFDFWVEQNGKRLHRTYYSGKHGGIGNEVHGFFSLYESVKKTIPYEFVGESYEIPEDSDLVLTEQYGDWRIPNSSWNYNEDQNQNGEGDLPHKATFVGLTRVMEYTTSNVLCGNKDRGK